MKKIFFILFLFSLSLYQSETFGMETFSDTEESSDFAFGVKKINDYLFVGKKEEGLHFIMERIDTAVPNSRLNFWKRYVADELECVNPENYFTNCEVITAATKNKSLMSQMMDFRGALESFETSVTRFYSNNELWIAYSSPKAIEKADDRSDIEMAVTVMTDKGAAMVTHMGISRSFRYLLKAAKSEGEQKSANKFKVHSQLAMNLHSFAAKVIRMRDDQKLYMITSPMPHMRDIMSRALPNNVHIGDTFYAAKKMYEASDKPQSKKEEEIKLEVEIKSLSNKIKTLRNEIDVINETIKNNNDLKEEKEYCINKKNLIRKEINTLTEIRVEKEDEHKDLFFKSLDQEDKEIQELAEKLEITSKTSPIKKTIFPKKIQIFDKERKHIVFDHNRDSKIVNVNHQVFNGDETKRFDWFYHRDMTLNPYATIDLDALSSYMRLMDSTLSLQ